MLFALALVSATLIGGSQGQLPTINAEGYSRTVQTDTLLATVRVINQQKDILGCGVILAQPGRLTYILTAAHLVRDTDIADVHFFSRQSYPKYARIVKKASVLVRRQTDNQDLALLRFSGYDGESAGLEVCPLKVAPKEKAFTGLVCGCAENIAPRLSLVAVDGTIMGLKSGEVRPARFWRTAPKADLGQSGGPLVNGHGQLLGICSGAQGPHGYYVHLEDIHAFLKQNGLRPLAGDQAK